MRDAVRHQIWYAAIIRGGEGRHVALSLATNPILDEQRQLSVSWVADSLRMMVQYIEQRLLPQGHGAGKLAAQYRRELDRAGQVLGELRGWLQHGERET